MADSFSDLPHYISDQQRRIISQFKVKFFSF